MDERERRIGQNEVVFRQVNEQIKDLNKSFEDFSDVMVIVCECGNVDCSDQIEMSRSEYEQIRSDPTLFAVKPGHETAGIEEVVRRTGGFDVVRKTAGLPARLAEATDPRS